jgi:hypothetical protein
LKLNVLTANRAKNAAAILRAFDDPQATATVDALSASSTEIEEFQAILEQQQSLTNSEQKTLKNNLAERFRALDTQLDSEDKEQRHCAALPITRLALVAWQMGESQYLERITSKVPRHGLTRGLIIELLAQTWTEFDSTWELATLAKDDDPLLPVALLSIEEGLTEKYSTLPEAEKQKTISRFLQLATQHPSAEVHATALFIWRKLKGDPDELPKEILSKSKGEVDRQWRVSTPSNLVLVRMEIPNTNGNPHRFEMTNTEITKGIYITSSEGVAHETASASSYPLNFERLSQTFNGHIDYQIASFCNQLSLIDGIDESNLCYKIDKSERKYSIDMSCTGYRLPTVEEWQFACAGTDWDQQFVNTCSLTAKTNSVETAQRVQRYVWLRHNASFEEQPTATRHPNPNGLFDMYGNVDELVMNIHDVEVDSNNLDYRLIGFNVFDTQSTLHNRITNKTELRTFKRNEVHPANGFRLVRTVKTP